MIDKTMHFLGNVLLGIFQLFLRDPKKFHFDNNFTVNMLNVEQFMFFSLFTHKLSDACVNKVLKFFVSHEIAYWGKFELNLNFSTGIL